MTSKHEEEDVSTTVKLHLTRDEPNVNYLHQPVPKKPSQLQESDLVNNKDSKSKSMHHHNNSHHSSASTSSKKLPSLVVKQDPNLKSCLSQTSSKADQSLPPPPQIPTHNNWTLHLIKINIPSLFQSTTLVLTSMD
ncbi:unnamed protein product [Candida parapsilosis]